MDAQRVDMFIMTNGKYFEGVRIPEIKDNLLKTGDDKWGILNSLQLKDPTLILIVSILVGALGIDRFLIGDTGLGVGKLLTCGGLGIWTIVDWFLIMGATREKNTMALYRAMY